MLRHEIKIFADEMEKLAEEGLIIIKEENIDEKGWGWTFSIVFKDGKEMWFRFCPFCGEKVHNLLTSTSLKNHTNPVCLNPDLPENRLGF